MSMEKFIELPHVCQPQISRMRKRSPKNRSLCKLRCKTKKYFYFPLPFLRRNCYNVFEKLGLFFDFVTVPIGSGSDKEAFYA